MAGVGTTTVTRVLLTGFDAEIATGKTSERSFRVAINVSAGLARAPDPRIDEPAYAPPIPAC